MIIKEMKNAIKEIRGINTYSIQILKFVMIFFDILVIAGAAVIFFPQLAGNGLAARFAADDILSAACRTLVIGVIGALIFDLMARKHGARD